MADPEIEAMASLAGALEDLDQDARGRVIRWAAERYTVSLGGTPPNGLADARSRETRPDDEGQRDDPDDDESSGGLEMPQKFQHFAELYDAVAPSIDPERVLVASYWTQVINGKASFGSQELNKNLKDLGHAVGTINKAMATNMRKKPALILQVSRGGSARQARKTYKLSEAGRKWVESKLQA